MGVAAYFWGRKLENVVLSLFAFHESTQSKGLYNVELVGGTVLRSTIVQN